MPVGSRAFNLAKEPRLITSRSTTGKVIYQEDWNEEPVKWHHELQGSIYRETQYALIKSGSLAVRTAESNWSTSEALMALGLPETKRLGLEGYFAMPDHKFYGLQLGLECQDAPYRAYGSISIRAPAFAARPLYRDLLNVEIEFPTTSGFSRYHWVADDYQYWHHFKLVVDFKLDIYVSFELDGVKVDMEPDNIGLYNFPTPGVYNIFYPFLMVQKDNSATETVTGLFDSIIVTHAEE